MDIVWKAMSAVLFLSAGISVFLPTSAFSADHRERGHWHGEIRYFHEHDLRLWRSGHWFHGFHGGRNGWWWMVNGVWYFYPQRVAIIPDPYVPPTVVIQQAPPLSAP